MIFILNFVLILAFGIFPCGVSKSVHCPSSSLILNTFSSSEPLGQFQPNVAQSYLELIGRWIFVCSNEGLCFYLRVDKLIYWRLKILILISTGPISTKLGIKYSWVMGIQVCSHDRKTMPFFHGHSEITLTTFLLQNIWVNFKQTWPKTSFGDGNSFFLNEWPYPFSKGDKSETITNFWESSS